MNVNKQSQKKSYERYGIFIVMGIFITIIFLVMSKEVLEEESYDYMYDVVEIKIDFDKNLTQKEIEINVNSVMLYFEKYESSYKSLVVYRNSEPAGTYSIITKPSDKPHYWKWKDYSLYIYVTAPLNEKGIRRLRENFYLHFFTDDYVDSIEVVSMNLPSFKEEQQGEKTLLTNASIAVDSTFISRSFNKHDKEKNYYTGREMLKYTCTVNFLITKKRLNQMERNHYMRADPFIVRLDSEMYMASIMKFKSGTGYYLALELDQYDLSEYNIYATRYAHKKLEYQNNCFSEKLTDYPYLKKLIRQRNFVKGFQGKPIKVSIEKQKFRVL